MKKIIIATLFVLILTSCSKEDTDEFIVEVCEETCLTSQEDYEAIRAVHELETVDLYTKIAPDRRGIIYLLSSGNFYDREVINRIDPITENDDVPILIPIKSLDQLQFFMYTVIKDCELGSDCETFNYIDAGLIKDLDYGFDESSGFYSFKGYNEDDELTRVESGRYNFDGDYGNFEFLLYFPALNYYEYQTFTDGIYESYRMSETSYIYTYIDIAENEIIYLTSSDLNGLYFTYTTPDQIVYKYYEATNSYDVMKYNDFELESSLNLKDNIYKSTINFHFIDGWDKLYKEDISGPGIYDKLYMTNTEVYTDYNIFTYSAGVRYTLVSGISEFTEEELDTYSYPSTFTGDMKFDELFSELDYLMSLDSPFDLIDLTETELLNTFDDYLAEFKEEYGVE